MNMCVLHSTTHIIQSSNENTDDASTESIIWIKYLIMSMMAKDAKTFKTKHICDPAAQLYL